MVVSFKLAYGQTILRYLSKVNENIGSQRVLYMNAYISFIHSNLNWKLPTVCQQVEKKFVDLYKQWITTNKEIYY